MKIEFSFPQGVVPGHVIDFLKDKLLAYHRDNKEVSDAEVIFRQLPESNNYFICQVILLLFGETLMVQRGAESYLQAARDVINEIDLRLEEVLKRINEPPQEVATTVMI
jgi:glucose/arabinose dehydrogenase